MIMSKKPTLQKKSTPSVRRVPRAAAKRTVARKHSPLLTFMLRPKVSIVSVLSVVAIAGIVIGTWPGDAIAQVPAGNPLAIAHRGGPTNFGPENIRPTFVKAAKAGYDIELDVRFSKPNAQGLRTPWILHDWALDRTTNCAGGLNSKTDDQLLKCYVTKTERIPTLHEALLAIHTANAKTHVIIHVQPEDMREVDALEVGKRVRWNNMQGQVVVMSWLPQHLAYFKKMEPTLPRARIFLKGTDWYSDPNAQGILVDTSELTAAKVTEAKAKGLTVYGSAETPTDYKVLQTAGVYANICDGPVNYYNWVKANPI